MAKDLPYFKFYCSEWSDGDISLEDMNIQGLFINVCAYYWSNEGVLTLSKCMKKFKLVPENDFKLLIESNIIKVDSNDNIIINFLNEQLHERDKQSIINKINGSKGGRPPQNKPKENQTETETKPNGYFSKTETITETEPKQKAIREEEKKEEDKREDITLTSESDSIDFEKLQKYWNSMTEKTLVPKIQIFSEQRKKKVKWLIKTYGRKEFEKAIKNLFESDFCTGKNGNWKADFDFLCQQSSFVKLVEGSYSNNNNQTKPQQTDKPIYVPNPKANRR